MVKSSKEDSNSEKRVRLQAKGGRKNAGEQLRMSAEEQALRSNVADNLVGITNANSTLFRVLFCYVNQGFQRVRML